jgi:hypothetical protein
MGKFDFDPNAVQATIEVLPKDTYTFEIKSVKPFESDKTDNGGKHTWGIRFNMKVSGGDKNGATIIFNGFMHNEGSQNNTKRFLMAAYGYTVEKEFNDAMESKDWNYDPDSGTVGSAWSETVGKLVVGNLDVQMGTGDSAGKEFQNFKGWQVYGS